MCENHIIWKIFKVTRCGTFIGTVAARSTSKPGTNSAAGRCIHAYTGASRKYQATASHGTESAFSILGCIAAALIGAILWAVITVATEYQIGYSQGVGALVGFGNRYAGKGIDKIFGIIGASFALVGCLLGNLFTLIAFAAKAEGLPYIQMISSVDWTLVPGVMFSTGSPIDVLFYVIAVYEGYRFSFRQISEIELMEMAKQ